MDFHTRLGKASQHVQDAVFNSVHLNVEKLIDVYMGSGMARMFRDQARAKIHDAQGRALTMKIVNDALDAEERARAEEAQGPPPA